MKRIAVWILIAGIVAWYASATITTPLGTSKINVTLVNQDPDPVAPGEIVEVRFKLENAGVERADNIEVEILPKFPFSILPGDTAIKQAGSLQARQIGENGVIIKYRLKVDEGAVDGESDLTLRYRIAKGGWITPKDFSISIRTFNPILYITGIESIPESIMPGSTGKITISYKNLADSLLENVKFRLTLDSVPLAPVQSSNTKVVEDVPAMSSGKVDFTLMAEASAKAKVYKVPLELSYDDKTTRRFVTNNTIGVVVGGIPELAVTIDSSTIVQSGTLGKIVVKFVNRGPIDTKFMAAKIEDTDYIKVVGSRESYIGNIDSDDFETEEFSLFVEKTQDGYVAVPIKLTYKDANNNDYSEEKELRLDVYTASEASKYGLLKGSSSLGIIITIIIVAGGIAGYYYYRKRKKK